MYDVELIASSCMSWLNMPVLFLDIIAAFILQVSHTHRGRCLCLALTAENISVRRTLPRCVIKLQYAISHTSTLLLRHLANLDGNCCLGFFGCTLYKGKKKKACGDFCFPKRTEFVWLLIHNFQTENSSGGAGESVSLSDQLLGVFFSYSSWSRNISHILQFWGMLLSSQTQIDWCVLLNPSTCCLNTGQVRFQETDFSILIKLWLSELSSCSRSVS